MIYDYRKEYYRKGSWQNIFWCAKIALIVLHTRYIVPGILAQKLSRSLKKMGQELS